MVNYIHIATFNYPSEIAIVKPILEANAIDYHLKDELTVQVHNFYSNAIGGIRLSVPKEHYQKAIDVLIASGNENYIAVNLEENKASNQEKKLKKLLKIVISAVVIIAILFILTIMVLFFFYE